jgi:hypothetical protein
MYCWLEADLEMEEYLSPRRRAWFGKLNALFRFMLATHGRDWEKEVEAWSTQNPLVPHR